MKNKGEILASILRDYNYCYFFLHNTKEFKIVEKIMNEGFMFENQIPHSTDRVNPNEPIEITYFLFQRKEYGQYTIVIAIPKEVYEKYTAMSEMFNTGIEEVITTTDPWTGDNDELMYVISPRHVLGYFSIKTSEFIRNSNWDPGFDNSLVRKPAKRPVKPDV
ncbi:MAG TPA: hypothetical protein PK766_06575 [Bacteroidales bacterium]|mgnify:CR=1 FL=1|nr:hypothetical protein [Bacteroidales bacterium]